MGAFWNCAASAVPTSIPSFSVCTWGQHVIHEHDHGLAFDDRLPGGTNLVILDVLRRDFFLLVEIGVDRLHIFLQAK
jgi:hypothetical protein